MSPSKRFSARGEALYAAFITNFHPAYFIINMGTGCASTLLVTHYPILPTFFHVISLILYGINVTVFLVLLVAFCIALARNPWVCTRRWFMDPSLAGFLGCLSMGFSTIINYTHTLAQTTAIRFVYALWWVNTLGALFTCFGITALYFLPTPASGTTPAPSVNHITPQTLHPTLLLPIVAVMVAASAGNVIWPSLPASVQFSTLVVTFMMWCVAIALAFMVMTLYLGKLYVYKFPARDGVFTGFLPVGVMGQSSYCILLMGRNVAAFMVAELLTRPAPLTIFVIEGLVTSPETLQALVWGLRYLTVFVSWFLLAVGFFFVFVTLFSIAYYLYWAGRPAGSLRWRWIPYHKGFWSMTFPIGTMALSLLENHRLFPQVLFFKVAGLMFSLSMLFVVVGCSIGVLYTFPWRLFGPAPVLPPKSTCESLPPVKSHSSLGLTA